MPQKLALVRHVVFFTVWKVLPVAVKGALYRRHRAKITGRKSIVTH